MATDVGPTPRNTIDESHRMWTSTKLLGDWPVKELCPQVALSSDSSVAFIHQERAIFALSIDENQWRRLALPKSISDAPYQSIEGLFMYDNLLHVLIEKREGKTALQLYDPVTGKWDAPFSIKKKMWCTSLTRSGSKVYSVDSWDGAVNVLDLSSKNAYKWQTLTKEENELLKNLGSFSLIAFRQRLYLFGGKKGSTEGSNDLYCFDLKKQQWSKVPVKGDVPPPRWGHSTVLSGGYFYIFGGINSMANLNDIYQFDIKRRRWRAVDALCPPPNGKCSSAAWICDDTLFRVAIKSQPHNDMLYSLELDTEDGEDEEVIENLQKSMKRMQKEMKKEAKKMRDEMQKVREEMGKKHAKDMKKLRKHVTSEARVTFSEDDIIEKIHKQLEDEAIKREQQRDNAQSMIMTSTVDDDQGTGKADEGVVEVAREVILKEVDGLLNDEIEEVRRELREELDETRSQLMEAIESLQRDHEREREEESDSESESESVKRAKENEEKNQEALREVKGLVETLKDEVARLRDEVTQLRAEKANSVRLAQRETTPTPTVAMLAKSEEPRLAAPPPRSNVDLVRVLSLLGISPTQTVLDQREIEWKNAKLIGNGAFGITKVFQTRWRGIECAVKRIKKDSLTLADMRAIQHDVDTISKTSGLHPHIAYVYGTCDPPEGGIGIVMELAHYGSVRDLLVRHTRLPVSLLLSLAVDAAEGLSFLHDHNIPHKNIAAASVMVSHGMKGMLSDFGMSKVSAHMRWMAPEMMPTNATSPPPEATSEKWMKADVWSFGVFLWEICTGQLLRPWQGSNDAQVVTTVLKDGKCLSVPDECHATLKNIIQCCWRRDPAQRPCPEELVDSLRKLLESVENDAGVVIEPLIQPLPTLRPGDRVGAGFGSSPFSLASQSSATAPVSALSSTASTASSLSVSSSSDAYTANQSAWITARLKQEWRKSSPVPHSPRAHQTDVNPGPVSASPHKIGSTTTTHNDAIDAINQSVATASPALHAQTDKKPFHGSDSALGRMRVDASAGKTRKSQTDEQQQQMTIAAAAVATPPTTTAPPPAAANNRPSLSGSTSRGSPSSSPYVPSFPSLSSSTRTKPRSSSLLSVSSSASADAATDMSSSSSAAAVATYQPSPATISLQSDASGLDSGSSHASSLPSGTPSPDSSPPPSARRSTAFSPLPSFSSSLHSSTDGEDGGNGSRGPRSTLSLSGASLNSSASSALQDEPPSPPHSPAASRRPLFSPLPTRLFD